VGDFLSVFFMGTFAREFALSLSHSQSHAAEWSHKRLQLGDIFTINLTLDTGDVGQGATMVKISSVLFCADMIRDLVLLFTAHLLQCGPHTKCISPVHRIRVVVAESMWWSFET